jgi:hypothetical protein
MRPRRHARYGRLPVGLRRRALIAIIDACLLLALTAGIAALLAW